MSDLCDGCGEYIDDCNCESEKKLESFNYTVYVKDNQVSFTADKCSYGVGGLQFLLKDKTVAYFNTWDFWIKR